MMGFVVCMKVEDKTTEILCIKTTREDVVLLFRRKLLYSDTGIMNKM